MSKICFTILFQSFFSLLAAARASFRKMSFGLLPDNNNKPKANVHLYIKVDAHSAENSDLIPVHRLPLLPDSKTSVVHSKFKLARADTS